MKARVSVTLKTGVLDPQGKAIEGALASLGLSGIASVRQGKLFDVELDDTADGDGAALLRQACERLLANTVIENYHVDLVEGGEGRTAPSAGASLLPPDAATEEAARDAEMPTEGHP